MDKQSTRTAKSGEDVAALKEHAEELGLAVEVDGLAVTVTGKPDKVRAFQLGPEREEEALVDDDDPDDDSDDDSDDDQSDDSDDDGE